MKEKVVKNLYILIVAVFLWPLVTKSNPPVEEGVGTEAAPASAASAPVQAVPEWQDPQNSMRYAVGNFFKGNIDEKSLADIERDFNTSSEQGQREQAEQVQRDQEFIQSWQYIASTAVELLTFYDRTLDEKLGKRLPWIIENIGKENKENFIFQQIQAINALKKDLNARIEYFFYWSEGARVNMIMNHLKDELKQDTLNNFSGENCANFPTYLNVFDQQVLSAEIKKTSAYHKLAGILFLEKSDAERENHPAAQPMVESLLTKSCQKIYSKFSEILSSPFNAIASRFNQYDDVKKATNAFFSIVKKGSQSDFSNLYENAQWDDFFFGEKPSLQKAVLTRIFGNTLGVEEFYAHQLDFLRRHLSGDGADLETMKFDELTRSLGLLKQTEETSATVAASEPEESQSATASESEE